MVCLQSLSWHLQSLRQPVLKLKCPRRLKERRRENLRWKEQSQRLIHRQDKLRRKSPRNRSNKPLETTNPTRRLRHLQTHQWCRQLLQQETQWLLHHLQQTHQRRQRNQLSTWIAYDKLRAGVIVRSIDVKLCSAKEQLEKRGNLFQVL